jgi:hypothetical protein
MAYYPLKIKQAYNFVLKMPAILGLGYPNATVMAIMDFDTAIRQQGDLVATHTQVYPVLGVNVSISARDLTYIRLKTSAGEYRVVAMEWIASEPELVTSQTIRVMISEVSIQDMQLIKEVLISNGFNSFTMEAVASV